MKLLVTGFQPFDGRGVNGSGAVIGEGFAASMRRGDVRIETRLLPVTWEAVDAFEIPLDVTHWVGLGEGHPYGIFVERVAHRARLAYPDEKGLMPTPVPKEANPDRFCLNLHGKVPWKFVPKGLEEKEGWYGIQSNYFAGGYICAALAYRGARIRLQRQVKKDRKLSVGFIHLPPQGEWEKENLGKEYKSVMRDAVRVILNANGWL